MCNNEEFLASARSIGSKEGSLHFVEKVRPCREQDIK
jgi:hypothetical protein